MQTRNAPPVDASPIVFKNNAVTMDAEEPVGPAQQERVVPQRGFVKWEEAALPTAMESSVAQMDVEGRVEPVQQAHPAMLPVSVRREMEGQVEAKQEAQGTPVQPTANAEALIFVVT